MTWEIWFSDSENSTTVFVKGHQGNAGTLEADARLITTFEAETIDEARAFKERFLYGDDGFFATKQKCEQTDAANRHPSGTSGLPPADPASRAGDMPEAGGDS